MKRAMVALLAACGGGHPMTTTDAGLIDAPPGDTVTITIDEGDVADNGTTVIFSNADGSTAATKQTAGGDASAAVTPGGYVTIAFNSADLVTYAGVQPGDHLFYWANPGLPDGDMFTVPLAAGATSYDAQAACYPGLLGNAALDVGSNAATGQLEFGPCGATGGGDFDVLVRAYDASGALVSTLWHPGAYLNPLDLTGSDTYAAIGSATASYTDVPSDITAVTTVVSTQSGALIGSGGAAPAAGAASIALPLPALGSSATVVETELATPTETDLVYDWGIAAGDYSLDLAGQRLASIGSPAFDPATKRLTWTAGSGAAADLIIANLGTWTIVAPYTAGSVQFPDVPGPSGTTIREIETLQVPGGYDAVRATSLPNGPLFIAGSGHALAAIHDGP